MPAEQDSKIKDAINELWKVHQGLYDGYDEIEQLEEKWTKDGDEKHADIAIARTSRMLGQLLTARKMIVDTCHPPMLQSEVLRMLSEICSALETALREASEMREYMQAHPEEVEDLGIVNYPMELLYTGWYCVAGEENLRLDLDLLVLENNWLREQVGSKATLISNHSDFYPPKPKLTDTERYILEALGTSVLRGPELLKRAGYDNSSHYRQILSQLVKRAILRRSVKGYYNPHKVQEDPTHS